MQTCMMYFLSLTSFFDSCICSWEVHTKVLSGAVVGLQKRRGRTGERAKEEKERLTNCHILIAVVELLLEVTRDALTHLTHSSEV